jgi:hypothetical protein
MNPTHESLHGQNPGDFLLLMILQLGKGMKRGVVMKSELLGGFLDWIVLGIFHQGY